MMGVGEERKGKKRRQTKLEGMKEGRGRGEVMWGEREGGGGDEAGRREGRRLCEGQERGGVGVGAWGAGGREGRGVQYGIVQPPRLQVELRVTVSHHGAKWRIIRIYTQT